MVLYWSKVFPGCEIIKPCLINRSLNPTICSSARHPCTCGRTCTAASTKASLSLSSSLAAKATRLRGWHTTICSRYGCRPMPVKRWPGRRPLSAAALKPAWMACSRTPMAILSLYITISTF